MPHGGKKSKTGVRMVMKLIAALYLSCLLGIPLKGYCQRKNEFGIVLQVENVAKHSEEAYPGATKTSHTDWNFVYGGQYEGLLSKHSSVSLAIKYRKALNDLYVPVAGPINSTYYAHFLVAENFLSFPFEYKYSFPLFTISAGPCLDYFLSWKEQQRYYYAPLQTYDKFFDKKVSIGLLGSISKKIPIKRNLVFEPTVYYNRVLSFERTYFGALMGIKYSF